MNAESVKQKAAALSLDAVGIAPLPFPETLTKILETAPAVPFAPADVFARTNAEALLPGARSAIVILFPYQIEAEETGANIARYARAKDYHKVNRAYLSRLAALLSEDAPDAAFYPVCDTSPMVDRYLAYLAGLGFYGKNHCLIHPKYGSYFTVGALLTTLPLAPDAPLSETCGTCRKCIAACPGRALSETGMRRECCKSYLTQKKELTPEEETILSRTPTVFGCDECQAACPYNEKAVLSPLPEIRRSRIPRLTEKDLENLSTREFERKYKDYAFAWRGKKILMRNLMLTTPSERKPGAGS